MRTLLGLGCVMALLACAESRKPSAGAAGAAAQGGGGAAPLAGAGADDGCQAHRERVLSFVETHRSCRLDAECQVVGACSAGFGFEAVSSSAVADGMALSEATPEGCQVFDGPLYESACMGTEAAADHVGTCKLLEIDQSCGEVPNPQTICDGSSDLRLMYSLGGGFVSPLDAFTNPYGSTFFAIDGECHFYASKDYDAGIYAGQLAGQEAARLELDLAFQHIASWKGSYGPQCADGSTGLLIAQSGRYGCTCGCDGAPAGARSAMAQAQPWVNRLTSVGKPLDAGMRALAYATPDPAPAKVFDWPLSRAPADIDGLVASDNGVGEGAHIEAGPDAMALRKLRADVKAAQGSALVIYVRVSTAKVYRLYLRDELPEAGDAALRAFRNATQ